MSCAAELCSGLGRQVSKRRIVITLRVILAWHGMRAICVATTHVKGNCCINGQYNDSQPADHEQAPAVHVAGIYKEPFRLRNLPHLPIYHSVPVVTLTATSKPLILYDSPHHVTALTHRTQEWDANWSLFFAHPD